MNSINFDDFRTWPVALLNYLDQNVELALNLNSVSLIYKAPKLLKFPEQFIPYLPLIEEVERIIEDCTIQCFHCTRITDVEIEDILSNGLQLPTRQFLNKKIGALQFTESSTKQDMMNFIGAEEKRHELDDPCIYFCISPKLLCDASATHRFFRNWGGEITYHQVEKNIRFRAALQTGKPAIIIVNLKPSSIMARLDLVTMVISRYLNRLDHANEPEVFECWVRQMIAPDRIEAVVRFAEPIFACLTNFTEEAL